MMYSHSGRDHTLYWVRDSLVEREFDGLHVDLS